MEAANYGILSLIPLALTLLLAFWKKDAVFALFMGCLSGVLLLGHDPPSAFPLWRRRLWATRTSSGSCSFRYSSAL